MTREEILAMPVGRELDALVAEKVIGLSNHYKFPVGEGTYEGVWFGEPPNIACYKIPYYSIGISEAWEVEEISLINGHPRLCCYIRNLSDVVGLEMDSLVGISRMVHATPEQRCKAALIAVLEGQAHETS